MSINQLDLGVSASLAQEITAFDHTTGTITIPGHGYLTGDGVVTLFVEPDSVGVVPTGLVAGDEVFVIRTSTDTLKLAATQATALAGTFLTFSNNGTLPVRLLSGIPYLRPRTQAAGSMVFHADFNALYDSLKAIWRLLTGQAQTIFTKIKLALDVTLSTGRSLILSGSGDVYHGDRIRVYNGSSAIPATNVVQGASGTATGTATATFTIPMDGFIVGDRLKSVTFIGRGSGAGTLTASVATSGGTGGLSSPGQTPVNQSNPVASDTDYTVTITSPTVLTANLGAWLLTAQISTAGTMAIANIRATYDRPKP